MKTDSLYIPMIPGIKQVKYRQCPARIGTVYKTLLQNRKLTTALLEQLTASTVSAESYNFIRDRLIFRSAVLISAGQILLFARSVIDTSLLDRQSVLSILAGRIPLGRILDGRDLKTDRNNFTYFSLTDNGYLSHIFSQPWAVSPSIRDRGLCKHIHPLGKTDIAKTRTRALKNQIQNHHNQYWGRSYEIYLENQKLASIEEIFSPDLQTRYKCS